MTGDPKIEIQDFGWYIRIEYKDVIDFEKQKRLIDMVHGLCLEKGIQKFIINTKGCQINYSILDRHKIGTYLAEKFNQDFRVATIIDIEQLTGIVENTSHNRGGTGFKIVMSEQDALDWIGEK